MNQQQINQQSAQQTMPQPPNVVSTKDEMYITDMLSWNLLTMKKAHFFAMHCQDQEIKTALEQAGQMHQRHYEKILSHLQPAGINKQLQQ
ncbi:hypothetical protein [Bacillus taeanensis]|uniref:Spore coat protein n=1 Tax=Bacillus taeanensis TaxID=273032 RepID=A0A366Y088_9BACI|nr:hypothetical protein [Bacillus taeanensis]RBW71248.1 hypothetical protein DS031_00405 [Bacillus taeanensis]